MRSRHLEYIAGVSVAVVFLVGCKEQHEANQAPYAPTAPSGASTGKRDSAFEFSSFVADMDGDSVSIRFAWGDGDTSGWSPWMPSGDTARMSHSWATADTFQITAQARDTRDSLSGWSPPHRTIILAGWVGTYGGSGSDAGNSVQQTADGGYIIAGYTESFGAGWNDVWLVKTNAEGDTQWTRTYGGWQDEAGNSVEQTTDGGYVVAGSTGAYGVYSDVDLYLIRTSSVGDTIWTRVYGGFFSDVGSSVVQASDGGFIATGYSESAGAGRGNVWLLRTNADGDTLWTRRYGGADFGVGSSVLQTADGGLAIAGYTGSFGAGGIDVYLIRSDANGDTLWTRTYGGTWDDWGASVVQTADGGFIVAGCSNSFGDGDVDVYLIRTDVNGVALWTRVYGGSRDDECWSVRQTADGGFILAGRSESFAADGEVVYLIKTDGAGSLEWERPIGRSGGQAARSAQQTTDGGYIVAGYTYLSGASESDAYLIKTDADGRVSP